MSLTNVAVVNNKFIELYDSPDIISRPVHTAVCVLKNVYPKKKNKNKNPYNNNGPASIFFMVFTPTDLCKLHIIYTVQFVCVYIIHIIHTNCMIFKPFFFISENNFQFINIFFFTLPLLLPAAESSAHCVHVCIILYCSRYACM